MVWAAIIAVTNDGRREVLREPGKAAEEAPAAARPPAVALLADGDISEQ